MPFLNPIVFWTGLGAVAVPVLIHLLNRRRFRVLDWAAMRFLLDSIRKNRRRLRIEELILLALRCLVLVVLATALARFTGCRAMSVLPGGASSQTAVFVLDDSYSMGQRVGAGAIFSAATTDLADQIAQLVPSDKLAILRTSDPDANEPFFKLTHVANAEVEALSARLAGLGPSDRRARLDRALSAAVRIFQDDESATRRLYLYGDFRRVDLAEAEASEGLRKAFDELRKLEVEVVTMDFGHEPKGNLTIESMELLDKFVIAGVPARVRLDVRNHGPTTVRGVEVSLKAQVTTPQGLREVELPAGTIDSIDRNATGRLEFQVTCPQAGAAFVSALLPADELAADNAAHLGLDVREAVRVLAVDGQFDLADPTMSESFFFLYALDPDRNGSEGTKVEVIPPAALGDAPLDDYDMVVLLNVPSLPILADANDGNTVHPQLEALKDYVRGGGGLAVFVGGRVDREFYNGPMYEAGSGLSPFLLDARKGDGDQREDYFRLEAKSLAAEPVLRVFRDFLAGGVDPTQFIRFYAFLGTNPIVPPPAVPEIKPPRVLARFTDEDRSPAIVARQFGAGTVLFLYTTASMAWNDWPADENGTFVALLNDMVMYLAKPQERSLSARVGEPIVHELPPHLRDAKARLQTPLHPTQPVVSLAPQRTVEPGGRTVREVVRYDRADHAGAYLLELALPDETKTSVLFARTVDPAEGDLACGRQDALAAAFGTEEFVYMDRTAAHSGRVTQSEPEKEYWIWALAVLAALLAVETFLGQRFGHYPDSGRQKDQPTQPPQR